MSERLDQNEGQLDRRNPYLISHVTNPQKGNDKRRQFTKFFVRKGEEMGMDARSRETAPQIYMIEMR